MFVTFQTGGGAINKFQTFNTDDISRIEGTTIHMKGGASVPTVETNEFILEQIGGTVSVRAIQQQAMTDIVQQQNAKNTALRERNIAIRERDEARTERDIEREKNQDE